MTVAVAVAPSQAAGGRTIRGTTYLPSGFAVVRTPFLPLEAFTEWSKGLEGRAAYLRTVGERSESESAPAKSPAALPAELAHALARDRARLRERMADRYQRAPAVREALFLASPDLEELLEPWLTNPEARHVDRVEMALVRYFQRMCGRPTPFGLFAGCSLAVLGEHTRIELAAASRYVRRSRLDMDYLSTLLDAVVAHPEVRRSLRFFPNDSLYRSAGRVRYVESRIESRVESRQRGAGRSHHLISVRSDEYLEQVLSAAAAGATIDELVERLIAYDAELNAEDARAYLEELASSQILVAHLGLPVTGPEAMGTMSAELHALSGAESFARVLDEASAMLADVDARGAGVDPARYRDLAKRLGELSTPVDLKRLIQVDLWKPATEAAVSTRVTSEILRGVELLQAITSAPSDTALGRFRQEFRRRYEDREVPLTEVLDEESGIGFERSDPIVAERSPFIAGLPLAMGARDPRVTWRPIHGWLLKQLVTTERAGRTVMTLDADQLGAFAPREPVALPDAFHVLATVIGEVGADPGRDGDVQIMLKGAIGPSGGRMLGRFCHLDDDLARRVRHHLRQEELQRGDAIFAEIVHLPEGRVGNILFRPILREYEIPYLARSSVPPDHQIPLGDLLVSVRGDRIALRSRRLGREIIPRLTNAHNFVTRAIGVYRFLGMLQMQDHEAFPRWDWGPLEVAPFLPRVQCGRLVFSLATWRLDAKEIERLASGDADRGFANAQELRARRGLPRFVQLADGDNTMPVDFDNAHSVQALRLLLRNRNGAALEEMIQASGETPVTGPEGRFRHELVVPYVKDPAAAPAKAAPPPPQAPPSTNGSGPFVRRFSPGSEWLYAKLYTGTATTDLVLRDVIAPVVDRLRASGVARRWFFVRYSDTDWHVRLRIQGDPRQLAAEAMPILHDACAPCFADGRIWSLQLDTYDREVERYGGPEAMLEAEAFFQADSEAVLEITRLLDGDAAAELRGLLAMHGIDRMLDDLAFTLPERLAIMESQRAGFWREFQGHPELSRKLGQKARTYAALVATLITDRDPSRVRDLPSTHAALAPGLESGRAILAERTRAWSETAARLGRLQASGRLQMPLAAIAGSFIHMHCNRMMRSAARAQELVMYDFLCREYKSRVVRSGAKAAAQREAVERGA